MLDNPLFRVLFDPTVNGGWNLIAWSMWGMIIGYTVCAVAAWVQKGK